LDPNIQYSQPLPVTNIFISFKITHTCNGCQWCFHQVLLYASCCVGDYACRHPNNYTVKFLDDTAALRLLNKVFDTTGHRAEIEGFVSWCDEYHLQLNVKKKTEEMILDPKSIGDHSPIVVNREHLEQVNS
jgi:hypothetical protein